MELKLAEVIIHVYPQACFNCTFMELKSRYAEASPREIEGFNCTFMELKYGTVAATPSFEPF